jgi:hypothetical protein
VRVTQKGVGAPTTLRQALTAYAGFTGTAITCSASALPTDTSDISFHQVFITGFNTAILKQSCDRLFLQDVKIASTNGITAQQCYDTCYWEKVELWPFLGSFASVQDQNSTVSDAANNGSGLIRLTLSAAPSTPLVTGDKVSVARVGGVPNATGRWTIAVVNPTTIDLQGSTWAGTYTSGGNVRLGLIIPGTGVNLANGSYEIHHLTVYGWDTDMAAGPAITESWCSDCWLDHYPAAGDPTPTSLAINAGVGTFSFTGFMYSSGKAVDLKAGALKITRSNIGGNVDSGAAVINVANAGSALLMGQSAINSAVTSGTASVITVDSAFTRVDLEGVVDYTVGDYFTIPPGPACGRFFQDGIAGPCAWTPSLLFGGASTGWVYTSSGVYTQTLNGAFINTEAKVVVSAKGTATGPVTITGLPSNTVKLTGTCSSPVNSGMAGLTGPLQGFTTLGVASIQLDNQGATGTGGLTHANFTATSNFYLNCSFIAGQ